MHVILPIIFLLKEQLCFFDNVGTDNVLFKNIIFMLDETLPSFGGDKKPSTKGFFSFHATLSFSLTNTLFNFNNEEKSRKQQKKTFLFFYSKQILKCFPRTLYQA